MTAGIAVSYANSALDTIGTAAGFAQLHTGDPGAAGTANPSSVTTREAVTWALAANGAKSISNQPSWGTWAGTSPETITHVSFWTLASGGNFVTSVALVSPVTITTGNPLDLSSQQITIGPLAA